MFNRSVYFGGSDTNIRVNAVSGGIVKNHKDSFFLRFNLKGAEAEAMLNPSPCRLRKATYDEKNKPPYEPYVKVPVEVLQLVIVGDMEVVAEVIDIPSMEQK